MFRYDQLSPDQLRFYRDEGYLLLQEAIASEAARTCREEVLDIMRQIGLGESPPQGDVDAVRLQPHLYGAAFPMLRVGHASRSGRRPGDGSREWDDRGRGKTGDPGGMRRRPSGIYVRSADRIRLATYSRLRRSHPPSRE